MQEVFYDFTLTENGYEDFCGRTFQELEKFLNEVLYKDRIFRNCCGNIQIYTDGEDIGKEIIMASQRGHGVYIQYFDGHDIKYSLRDRNKLEILIDVWGDGLNISEGLFIEPEKAWEVINEFISCGKIVQDIEWITGDELPEGADVMD